MKKTYTYKKCTELVKKELLNTPDNFLDKH